MNKFVLRSGLNDVEKEHARSILSRLVSEHTDPDKIWQELTRGILNCFGYGNARLQNYSWKPQSNKDWPVGQVVLQGKTISDHSDMTTYHPGVNLEQAMVNAGWYHLINSFCEVDDWYWRGLISEDFQLNSTLTEVKKRGARTLLASLKAKRTNPNRIWTALQDKSLFIHQAGPILLDESRSYVWNAPANRDWPIGECLTSERIGQNCTIS